MSRGYKYILDIKHTRMYYESSFMTKVKTQNIYELVIN